MTAGPLSATHTPSRALSDSDAQTRPLTISPESPSRTPSSRRRPLHQPHRSPKVDTITVLSQPRTRTHALHVLHTHRETMSNTYKFTIDKRAVTTTVIATEPDLDRSLKDMLSSFTPKFSTAKRVVGLGIEKRFETIYNGGPKMCDRVAILKLCHGTTCLIIQLHLMSSPPFSLSGFLQRPELSFVGVGIKHSLEALVTEYGIKCRNAVDLAQLAATVKKNDIFKAFGLFDLAYEFSEYCRFDDHVEKMVSNFHDVALSNWGVTALSGKQIEAATWTCFLCFFIGNYLLGGTLPSTSRGY